MNKRKIASATLMALALIFFTMLSSLPKVVHAANGDVASVGQTTYATLEEAISAANGAEIQLLKDITLTKPIEITSDTKINGKKNENEVFQIDASGGGNHRTGLFHMNKDDDAPVSLTLKNLNLVNKTWSNPCGVSVRASNQMVTLENVTIDTGHYCLLVGVPNDENEDVNHVTINIDNSKLTGYATIYYRTNSTTNPIKNPVLNVKNSELTGRGFSGYSNGFSTIVYNGTRDARATISNSTLSNSFDSTNADAEEGIIQFNHYGACEEGAEITISNSKVKTRSTTSAPNIIKYTDPNNLNVGNKVIVDDLTILVDEHEGDLLRVMRNGNELVATGKELDQILSLDLVSHGKKPGGYAEGDVAPMLTGGDTVLVPIDTTLTADAVIPENVTVVIAPNAKLRIAPGVKLTAAEGAKISGAEGAELIVEGTVEGLDEIAGNDSYIWGSNTWGVPATGITLDKSKLALQTNDTAQLTATVQPENAVSKAVTWTSSNESIARVDNTGKVTAVGSGTATITATVNDTTLSASCIVEVSAPKAAADPTQTDGTNNGSVKTGDQTNMGLYIVILAMSGLLIAVSVISKKKKALEK